MTFSNKTVLFILVSIVVFCLAMGCAEDDDSDSDSDSDPDDDDDDDDDETEFECDESHPNRESGLIRCQTGASEGYTLFAPTQSTTTYLIDMFGHLVHSWESEYRPGESAYLLEDGKLLRTFDTGPTAIFQAGGKGGGVQLIDWDGSVIWTYAYCNDEYCQHHDVEMLPNGNVLLIAWERLSEAQVIQAGRNPALLVEDELWPDTIIEVEPDGDEGGKIVWQWRVWDHLIQDFSSDKDNFGVVQDHPERIDINYAPDPRADWIHLNAVDYNEELDQIMVSSRVMSEIWVIDHSTTEEESAGHTGGVGGKGGDLLYRWGNPAAYRAGSSADQIYYLQHDGHWIEKGLPGEGNILVFNNGLGRPGGNYSTVDQIVPPVSILGDYSHTAGLPFGPESPNWTYAAVPEVEMFSSHFSGAGRLPNGNTLICVGRTGKFIEVTEGGQQVWLYINPIGQVNDRPESGNTGGVDAGNMVFRAYRYAPDYPGLTGRDLTPGEYLTDPQD
jgi:Arylsulfotransferase (ASST)